MAQATLSDFSAEMPSSTAPSSDGPQSSAEMHRLIARAFHSERLLFRSAVSPADDDFLFAINDNSDAAISSNIGAPVPARMKDGQDWIKRLQNETLIGLVMCLDPAKPAPDPPLPPEIQAKVQADREAGKATPIGVIMLRNPYPASAAHHRQGELGIDVLGEFQGRGYGGEAIRWMVEWGFSMGNLHRILIRVFSWNEKAIGLYRKVGFRFEAREVEAIWFAGRWWDNFYLAMLDREWRDKWRDAPTGRKSSQR